MCVTPTLFVRATVLWIAFLCLAFLIGCSSSKKAADDTPIPVLPPPPPPTPTISLSVAASDGFEESANPKVQIEIQLDIVDAAAISVGLNFSGSATRNNDYVVDKEIVEIPANTTSGTAEIDIYRDFDAEGDETIEISLGTITGNAQAGTPTSATVTIRDGEAVVIDKTSGPGGVMSTDFELFPLAFEVHEDSVVLLVIAVLNSVPAGETVPLTAQWSTDYRFQANVHVIDTVDVVATDEPIDPFLNNFFSFSVPIAELAPNETYFVRAYLGFEPPPTDDFGAHFFAAFFDGFRTNAEGRVIVWCESPERSTTETGDPLFSEQWHLVNTGQTAFSDRGGTAGGDLRMAGAIAANQTGSGVKLGIVDTGLELCHPDLAANAASGGSFNFGYERKANVGALPSDPFNFGLVGDHGTSVAGVAGSVANNGFGGRGVAPDVELVGFNPAEASSGDVEDPETGLGTALLLSLGGSDSEPDSASVDIFNMSFGFEAPGENSQEEFVRLFEMATSKLRNGRGALYVKAAGNAFDFCDPIHPFIYEVGCYATNSDPDHNLPYLIVVGGFNADDVKSSYSSAGANLWVVGPSGETGLQSPAMITTDQAGAHGGYSAYFQNRLTSDHALNPDGDYISSFGGTSSAAPAVAGAIAVLLSVEPALTWRDVKHILANTARTIDSNLAQVRAAFQGTPYVAQHAWQTNAAGYDFHTWYGFGAFDIDAAVAMAASYSPNSLGTFVESTWFDGGGATALPLDIPDADGAGVTSSFTVSEVPTSAAIEAVVLEVRVEHANTFDIGITLTSPAGTASVVNPPFNRLLDQNFGLFGWHLLSNAFYGENPNGSWTIHVADLAGEDTGSLASWRLRFYYGDHSAN